MINLNGFKALEGKEFSVWELSNELVKLGAEDLTEFSTEVIEQCIEDGCIVLATDEAGEEHIKVEFKLTLVSQDGLLDQGITVIKIEEY